MKNAANPDTNSKKSKKMTTLSSKKILFSKKPISLPLYSDTAFWQRYFEMEGLLEAMKEEDPLYSLVIHDRTSGESQAIAPVRFRSSKGIVVC